MNGESRPGKVGKSYPAALQDSKNNQGPTAQASVSADKYGWIALLVAILSLVFAVAVYIKLDSISSDMENVRSLIDNSANNASQSAGEAALAAERADKAERSAAINREYAVQVVGQLNRMGFPVMSPGEKDHPLAQPEDYDKLDAFAEQHKEQQK